MLDAVARGRNEQRKLGRDVYRTEDGVPPCTRWAALPVRVYESIGRHVRSEANSNDPLHRLHAGEERELAVDLGARMRAVLGDLGHAIGRLQGVQPFGDDQPVLDVFQPIRAGFRRMRS